MRTPTQFTVTTTEQHVNLSGKKFLLATAGAVVVKIAFTYALPADKHEGGYVPIPANTTFKFKAPRGHTFYNVFFKTDAGTSTLDVTEMEEDIWTPHILSSGEQIINGGFETNGGYASQNITGWVIVGDWCAVDQAHSYTVHSGSFCCMGGNNPITTNSLKQTLGTPVPVSAIKTFGFWLSYFPQYPDSVKAIIHYTDASTNEATFICTGSYAYCDLMSYLTAGKSVSAIEFQDLGTNGWGEVQIDDATLTT